MAENTSRTARAARLNPNLSIGNNNTNDNKDASPCRPAASAAEAAAVPFWW